MSQPAWNALSSQKLDVSGSMDSYACQDATGTQHVTLWGSKFALKPINRPDRLLMVLLQLSIAECCIPHSLSPRQRRP